MPDPSVAVQLLLSSRGLLTLAPVLALGIAGTVILYRRGDRAEAAVIAAVGPLALRARNHWKAAFSANGPS